MNDQTPADGAPVESTTGYRLRSHRRGRPILATLLLGFTALAAGAVTSASHVAPALAGAAAQVQVPLPPLRDLDEVARETSALHRANGGATVSLYHGDLSGRPLYVVVVYPELSRAVEGRELDAGLVHQFIAEHLPLLADPRNNVGSWYDPVDGRTYLDISTALPDRELAFALARRYNQMGVFDLSLLELLDAGGSGEVPAGLPPIAERLPPLPAGVRGTK
jgi:hypothetical protein